ncbi:MAG: hypothetical protein IT383_20465 [Deltaproteobacteria bacterium]|nr:hypothetical protein [Deltaproteobacteria bacterium]
MDPGERLALLCCCLFFLVGLVTGVWKFVGTISSPEGRAHRYVDVLHRAALMYSFACLVMARLCALSPLGASLETAAVISLVVFFTLAQLTYGLHGVLKDTDNQLRAPFRLGAAALPRVVVVGFMVCLIVGEVGGFSVLAFGAVRGLGFW